MKDEGLLCSETAQQNSIILHSSPNKVIRSCNSAGNNHSYRVRFIFLCADKGHQEDEAC